MTFLKKFHVSIMTRNVKNNNIDLFMVTLKSLYMNRMMFNGYVTDIVEIVEFSLGELKRNVCEYEVLALVEILSLSPGNILEDCIIESIETIEGDVSIVFLHKYDHKFGIIMIADVDDASGYTINQSIDVRIQGSSVKPISDGVEIFAVPVKCSLENTYLSSQMHILDMNVDNQILSLNDKRNIDKLISMKNNIGNKFVSIYHENNVKNEHKELKKILSLFYPDAEVKFVDNAPHGTATNTDISLDKYNIQAVRINMFDVNFNLNAFESKKYYVNYIVSSASVLNGYVYILYTRSTHAEINTLKHNTNIYMQFMNNYISKLLNMYYTEEYVVNKNLDWTEDISFMKSQYNKLIT